MKKHLLLAAVALLGLAPNASALKQVSVNNIDQCFKDGDIIALQTPSRTGGRWSWWNGPGTQKTTTLQETGLLKVVTDNAGRFYLQNYSNPTQYLSQNNVSWTDNTANAAHFEAYIPETAGEYSWDQTQAHYIEKGENTVRLNKGTDRIIEDSRSFLNCQGNGSAPTYASGIGGWSWWFAYVLDEDDVQRVVAGNPPSMIECFFTYDSPLGEESPLEGTPTFNGMSFMALEGVSIDQLPYENSYANRSQYFTEVVRDDEKLAAMDKIVSPTNNKFPVKVTVNESSDVNWSHDWNTFMEVYNNTYSKVHRIDIRPLDTVEDYVSYSYILDGDLRADNTNKLFGASHMWYLKYKGLDALGYPMVNIMSVQFPDKGLTFTPKENGSLNDIHAKVTEEPTDLSFFFATKNSNAGEHYTKHADDFVLGIPIYGLDDNNHQYAFINDFNGDGIFSTYQTSHSNGSTDLGSIMRMLPLEDEEFNNYKAEVEACGYFRVLDILAGVPDYDNGVDITDQTIAKAKETRDPMDVTKLFPENVNLFLGLRTYKELTGICQLDNENQHSVPGYVPAETCKALYDAMQQFKHDLFEDGLLTDENNVAVATARWNLVNGTPAVAYLPTPGAIYTIKSTELNDRGYLCNVNDVATSTVSSLANGKTYSTDDPDFQFTFVKIGEKYYMYNLGAEKFMNAFGRKTDISSARVKKYNCSDHTWRLNDHPTAMREFVQFKPNTPNSFAITAGMTSGNETALGFSGVHEGGLTIMNGCQYNVVVSFGVSDRTDGNGLIATYVGALNAEELAAVTAKAEEAIAAVPAVPASFDDIDGILNHFDSDTYALLTANTTGGTLDHIHYLAETGGRQEVDVTKVYNLFVDDSHAYMHDKDNGIFKVATFVAGDPQFNFKPVVSGASAVRSINGRAANFTFAHNFNGTDKSLEVAGSSEIDLSELGKVKIGDQTVTAKVGEGVAETTAISEITVENAADVIYDVMGRRMAAPVKGINIINGKKAFVR